MAFGKFNLCKVALGLGAEYCLIFSFGISPNIDNSFLNSFTASKLVKSYLEVEYFLFDAYPSHNKWVITSLNSTESTIGNFGSYIFKVPALALMHLIFFSMVLKSNNILLESLQNFNIFFRFLIEIKLSYRSDCNYFIMIK